MGTGAKEAIAAQRRSHDEMVEFVRGLDAQELGRRSGSAEWTVAQVLSHLGSAAEIGLNTLRAGRADLDASPAIWDRWNAMSASDQASNFVVADERLVEATEALDDEELSTRKIDVGFLPAPVDIAFVVGLRLSEVGLHKWDVDVAFDPNATVAAHVVPIVLERLPLFAGFFAQPGGRTGAVAIETSGPDARYVLELSGDSASMSEGTSDRAGSVLRLPGESLLRLTSGRLAPEHTPSAVAMEGDLSLDDLRAVFPGY